MSLRFAGERDLAQLIGNLLYEVMVLKMTL